MWVKDLLGYEDNNLEILLLLNVYAITITLGFTLFFFFLWIFVLLLYRKKVRRGDLITPWNYSKHRIISISEKQDIKNYLEYYVGFCPIKIPYFFKYCKNGCGKQTQRVIGECVHCQHYRKIYHKEPPAKQQIIFAILIMNKRNDNEFSKLPKHLVVHIIQKYL